ncbi:MAG: serine hydrolase [Maribacter sp.]|uniref:serine hydrolase n=1 Tax=Maribacter sp. TaxID=1897614 RepID=UPI00329A3303
MKFYSALLALLFTTITLSQKTDASLKGIDRGITNLMQQYDAIGLSVAVIHDGKIIYAKGFGYRDIENKLPVTENTVFHIASMTKAFTGALLGILESENKLSLKDKPALYVPNFQFCNDKMNNLITIEDLLSHKSGLGNHGASMVMFPDSNKLRTVQRLQYLKPETEVKNSWEYSNIGYTLAGTVVEQVTRKTWDTNILEQIFRPLKMNSSFTTLKAMKASNNYATGYAMNKEKVVKVPYENYYSYTPAGAIKSSVKDLSNWMSVWLNKGRFEGHQVIPENYIYQASRPQNLKYDEEYSEDSFLFTEGFGWRIRSWNGHYRLRHGGNTNGFSTIMELFPFKKIGVVVLCNKSNTTLPYIVSDYITRKLLDLSPEKEYPVLVHDMYQGDVADKPFNKAKMPTHKPKDFIGNYDAKGYGRIKIINEENGLFAQLPTFKFKLEHIAYNNFYLKGLSDFKESFNPEFTVKFVHDTKGNIEALELVAQKEPIQFKKAFE